MSAEWFRFFMEMYQHSGLALANFKMWEELAVTAFVPSSGSPPTLTAYGNIENYAFSASATNTAYGTVTLPGRYIDGTDLWPFIRWAPSNTSTNNCVWEINYRTQPEGTAYGVGLDVDVDMTQAGGGSALAHQIAEGSSAIDGDSFKSGDVITFAVTRYGADPGDAFTGVAHLLSAGFHFLAGVPGKNGRTQ